MTARPIWCSSCGAENEAGSGFCESCGAPLANAPKAEAPAPAASPAHAAAPTPAERSRSKLFLLGGVVVAVALLLLLWRTGNLPGIGTDRLVSRLVAAPLPPDSYQGWKLQFTPSLTEADAPEPGQVGNVMAHLGRGSSQICGFSFTVFKTPAQAEASYRDASTYDQTHFPTLTPERLERMRQSVITPPGVTASCLDGGTRASCHALVGRTVVFVFMDGGSVQDAIASTTALVSHVSALEK